MIQFSQDEIVAILNNGLLDIAKQTGDGLAQGKIDSLALGTVAATCHASFCGDFYKYIAKKYGAARAAAFAEQLRAEAHAMTDALASGIDPTTDSDPSPTGYEPSRN